MLDQATRARDFPALQNRIYLNTAAEGIPPRAVLEALRQYGEDKLLGFDGRKKHEAQWDKSKTKIGEYFGLSADEVSMCASSSEAFNWAALALNLQADDEVIISDLDFPAGATPWLLPSCPAIVRVWRHRAGALRVEDLKPLLSARTRLVTVSLVSFFNGFKVRWLELVDTISRYSPALVAVDITQALGRVPLQISGADLIISSTHKWILASHGGGLVGVPAARARDWTVPAGGWFNLQNAFGADRFDQPSRPQIGAASFSVGMPNYPAVYAVAAALEYLDSVSIESIEAHAAPLIRHCLSELKKLPVEILTPDEPDALAGIIAFRHEKAEEINHHLHCQNIHIMAHANRLRVSIHGYNSQDDVDVFLQRLSKILQQI